MLKSDYGCKAPIKNKPFVITGSARSGTSLLSAILGTHPKIVVINEDYDSKAWPDRVYNGDGLVGAKLPMPRLMYEKKSNELQRLLWRKFHKLKWSGIYGYTLRELEDRGYPIIVMNRSMDNIIRSIKRHTGKSEKRAEKEALLAIEQINKIKKCYHLPLSLLTEDPEVWIKEVLEYLGRHYGMKLIYDKSMLEGYKYAQYYAQFYHKITPRT